MGETSAALRALDSLGAENLALKRRLASAEGEVKDWQRRTEHWRDRAIKAEAALAAFDNADAAVSELHRLRGEFAARGLAHVNDHGRNRG